MVDLWLKREKCFLAFGLEQHVLGHYVVGDSICILGGSVYLILFPVTIRQRRECMKSL